MAAADFADDFRRGEGLSAGGSARQGCNLINPDDAVIAYGCQVAAGGVENKGDDPG